MDNKELAQKYYPKLMGLVHKHLAAIDSLGVELSEELGEQGDYNDFAREMYLLSKKDPQAQIERGVAEFDIRNSSRFQLTKMAKAAVGADDDTHQY